jgi:small subunit ribosomal protein S1
VEHSGTQIKLEPGQEFDFKVIKMNPAEKKVGLSIRAVGEEATRADVEAYKGPAAAPTSSGTGSTIGEFMSWKRASGENN